MLAALACAQPQPSVVSGMVVDDGSGTLLAGAVVTLAQLSPENKPVADAVAWTDNRGAFSFFQVPPGSYVVRAARKGYVFSAQPAFSLAPGENHTVELRLRPVGSISGTVRDADGDSVAKARVILVSAGGSQRSPGNPVAETVTDDRGRYHLLNLQPGKYILLAIALELPPIVSEAMRGQPASEPASAMQFYPDAERPSGAAPVVLRFGKDLDDLDFRISPRAGAKIEGRVVLPRGATPGMPVRVHVANEDTLGYGFGRPVDVTGSDGGFQVTGLPWGRYVLSADLDIGSRGFRAVEHVDAGKEPGRAILRFEPLADITGSVRVEGDARKVPRPFRIGLLPRDPLLKSMNLAPELEIGADGAFRFDNLIPGVWTINPHRLPEGCYIQSLRLGTVETPATNIVIGPGANPPLNIVLDTEGAVVEGGVESKAQAFIVLVPRPGNNPSLPYAAVSDKGGRFKIGGVAPGGYWLCALDSLDEDLGQRPDLVKALGEDVQAVEVPAAGHLSRQLRMITAAAPEGTR